MYHLDARGKIIDIMNKSISEPRKTKKANTPEIETLTIPSHKRGRFLGIGGVNLKRILAQTGIKTLIKFFSCLYCFMVEFRCYNTADR